MMNTPDPGDIRYNIDTEHGILYAERHDALTKDRVYAEWDAMKKLEGFNPAHDTIVDYSRVTDVDIDVTDLMELNREMPKHDPRTGNIAIVAGLSFGRYVLGRFYCSLANRVQSRKHQIFHTLAEAEAWIHSLRK